MDDRSEMRGDLKTRSGISGRPSNGDAAAGGNIARGPRRHLRAASGRARRAAALSLSALLGAACSPASPNSDASMPHPATDIFVRVADAVPGGALLGTWVALGVPSTRPFDRAAYLVGGYAGVPRAALGAGTPAGRLMGYDGNGQFDTLCPSDQVLRGVYGQDGLVYAVGDAGRVVVYDSATHQCMMQQVGDAGDAPTLRAIAGTGHAPAEIYLAGTTDAGAALYAYDGTAATRVTLPAAAQGSDLQGVAYNSVFGWWVVGSHGVALSHPLSAGDWQAEVVAGLTDNLLSAVSTDEAPPAYWSMVVGGTQATQVLARRLTGTSWMIRGPLPDNRPLRGIYLEAQWEVYMVGLQGATMVFNGRDYYVPPGAPLTTDDLYAVHGRNGMILAVGGDATTATTAQHGVILMRGDLALRDHYTVNGTSYTPVGNPRVSFGAAGVMQARGPTPRRRGPTG
jgi:hypothetical protein